MYTFKSIILISLTLASVLKVDVIKFTNNTYDPLGINEPLSRYRMSYNFSTSNIINSKDTISHTDNIKNGIHKKLKVEKSSHENDNKNLHKNTNKEEIKSNESRETKENTNLQHSTKCTENLQQNEKSTGFDSSDTLGDRIPENKKKDDIYNYKSCKRMIKRKKSKKTYKINKMHKKHIKSIENQKPKIIMILLKTNIINLKKVIEKTTLRKQTIKRETKLNIH